jgi:hypothetical protein
LVDGSFTIVEEGGRVVAAIERPSRARREGLSGGVRDELDAQHAARRPPSPCRARLASEEGPHGHAACIASDVSKPRARAAIFLEGRRRWQTAAGAGFWLVEGAEEFGASRPDNAAYTRSR